MSEQHKIELAFSRSRFAIIIGTAIVTGVGLLAAGLFAGMELGSVQARAASPPVLAEAPTPLPWRYVHESPVIERVQSSPGSDWSYVVQAASFRDRDEAARLTEDLARRGYAAGISDFKDEVGRSWLIVRVGPYSERAEASQVASELAHFTRSEPIVRGVDN